MTIRTYHHLGFMVVVLLVAALLRIVELSRLPPGFNQDEITTIQVVETARPGIVASFYQPANAEGGQGYEGLYPILQAISTSLLGDGLLCYRIFSVWCGLISIALIYALGRRLFGSYAGLVAAIALAVTLWPVLLSRLVIRETLLLPLILAFLYMVTRALHLDHKIEPQSPITLPYTVVGILIALLAYTHWTGLIAAPLFIVFLIYLVMTRQPISRRVLGFSGYTLLLAAIIGIPYLTFSLRLFRVSGIYAFWANRPESLGALLNSSVETLISTVIYGDQSLQQNLPGYPLIGQLGAVLLIIGLITAIRRWRSPNMMFVVVALLWGLFPDAWSRSTSNFRMLTVALPALSIFVALGAVTVVTALRQLPDVWRNPRLAGITALIVVVSAALVSYLLFNLWAQQPMLNEVYQGQLGRIAAYLDRTDDGVPTTICTFRLNVDKQTPISDSTLLDIMMHNPNRPLRFSNCLLSFILTDGGKKQRIAYASPEVADALAPTFAFWTGKGIPVANHNLLPNSVIELDVEKELADTIGTVTLASVDWPPDTTGSSDKAMLPVRMGGYLTFEGYTLDTTREYKPGDTVTLITYWRADGNQIPDLRIFAHILGFPNAEPLAQHDLLTLDESLLRDRDVFIQIIQIPLSTDFPTGEYYISVGAYNFGTSERLPVYDHDQPRGDRLFLDKITVQD